MRLGIRQKLVVLVLVILVPMLALLAFNVLRQFEDLQNDEVELHARDARIVAASLDRFLDDMAQLGRATGLAVTAAGTSSVDASNAFLAEARAKTPASNIAFLDTRGVVRASAIPSLVGTDLGGEPAFRSTVAGQDVAVTGLRRNASGRLGVAVFTRVVRDGKLLGISVVAVDAEDLGAVVRSSVAHGTVFITDAEGTLVYSSLPELAALNEQQRREWEGPGVQVALGGGEFTSRRTAIPDAAGRWLGAVVPAKRARWATGLFDQSGSALADIRAEAIVTVAIVIVVVGLSLLGARQYGLSITDPIERLTAVTNEIERGRFDADVPVATRDEVGELAENFRQMQESLKRTLGDVQVLAESARWMSSTLDLDGIARAAGDYLQRILGARAVAVTLFEEGKRGDTLLAPRLGPDAASELVAAGALAARTPSFARRGYVVVPYEPDGALAEAAPHARTLVILALVVNRRLIGRIDVLAAVSAPLREFAQADVPLAASIAQQVASAAENARLFEQQRLIADTLQDSLLTVPYPIQELAIGLVYHQATVGGRIGGDFYDFIPVGRECTAVVIGDISGKGLNAARFTTIGKGALRAFAIEDPDPASTLGRASHVIAEQIGIENFVTAVYVLIDFRAGGMRYAVAGHPPPIVLRADGTTDILPGGGVPLGVEGPVPYEAYEAALGPGDRLLLYTDGLSEARRAGELFGIERIAAAFAGFGKLPVQDVAVGIAEAAIAYAGGQLDDDLAIIVIERRAPVEGDAGTSA